MDIRIEKYLLFILLFSLIVLAGCKAIYDPYNAGITCRDARAGATIFGQGDVNAGFDILCSDICLNNNVKYSGQYDCDSNTGDVICYCGKGGTGGGRAKSSTCGKEFWINGMDKDTFFGTAGMMRTFGENEFISGINNQNFMETYVINKSFFIEKIEDKDQLIVTLNFKNNESIEQACIEIKKGIFDENLEKAKGQEYCQDTVNDPTPPGIIIPLAGKDNWLEQCKKICDQDSESRFCANPCIESFFDEALKSFQIRARFKVVPKC